jgi:hypothetical protein
MKYRNELSGKLNKKEEEQEGRNEHYVAEARDRRVFMLFRLPL